MSKPNMIRQNMPKNPFEHVAMEGTESAANARAAVERAAGFETKVTRMRVGSNKRRDFAFNVWRREK